MSKNICVAFLLLVLGLSSASAIGKKKKQASPNVILLMADDMGWGDVGFNGNTTIHTPGLDKLAASGVILNRFYSAAPVCSPTRGSCITGRHPFRYGIFFANKGKMKDEEVTIAEVLKQKGYATAHFGKWHLGSISTTIPDGRRGGKDTTDLSTPWGNGFDVCFSTEQAVPTWNPMEFQTLANPTRYWTAPGIFETENLKGDDSRVIMDRVLPFIENAVTNDTPFLTVIWFHTPHSPVVAGPEYRAMYQEYDENKQHYYGCITALDEQVARLQAELEKLHIDDNTLITFCSDNGPAGAGGGIKQYPGKRQQGSTGGFRGRKGSLYEGGVRVPAFMVYPPKIKANTTSDFLGGTSDYFPSVLGLLGIESPDNRPYDGQNLLGALANNSSEREGYIGFQSQNKKSIVSQQYKLITDNGKDYELYDLTQDPHETNDISDANPDIVIELKKQLVTWVSSCAKSNDGVDY